MNFYEMIRTPNIGEICRGDLRRLTNEQLEAFARLLGIPYSGDKQKRVKRIFAALGVRYFLLQSDDPKFYESKYSRRELVKYTKSTGSYVASTKYGLAVGLLNWRIRCRRQGTCFYKEMVAEIKTANTRNKQRKLF